MLHAPARSPVVPVASGLEVRAVPMSGFVAIPVRAHAARPLESPTISDALQRAARWARRDRRHASEAVEADLGAAWKLRCRLSVAAAPVMRPGCAPRQGRCTHRRPGRSVDSSAPDVARGRILPAAASSCPGEKLSCMMFGSVQAEVTPTRADRDLRIDRVSGSRRRSSVRAVPAEMLTASPFVRGIGGCRSGCLGLRLPWAAEAFSLPSAPGRGARAQFGGRRRRSPDQTGTTISGAEHQRSTHQ